jgi:hypothetical protein
VEADMLIDITFYPYRSEEHARKVICDWYKEAESAERFITERKERSLLHEQNCKPCTCSLESALDFITGTLPHTDTDKDNNNDN